MKRLVIFAVVLAAAVACSPKGQNPYEYSAPEFKKTYKVDIVPLNNDLIISNVVQLFQYEDKLIARAKNIDNKNVFQVISLKDGTFLGSFGMVGRGDKELVRYYCTTQSFDGNKLYSIDNNAKTITFDLTRATEPNNACAGYACSVGTKCRTTQLHSMPDGSLLHLGVPRIFLTDGSMLDTIQIYNNYPPVTEVIDADEEIKQSYFRMQSNSTVNPSRTKMAIATNYGMLLEIFDIASNKIVLVANKYFYEPKMANIIAKEPDCVWGTAKIKSSDKYIYILYTDSFTYEDADWKLGVFDWRGSEVCCYTFDDLVSDFIVTPDDKRAYCWVMNADGEEYLGYFDLK